MAVVLSPRTLPLPLSSSLPEEAPAVGTALASAAASLFPYSSLTALCSPVTAIGRSPSSRTRFVRHAKFQRFEQGQVEAQAPSSRSESNDAILIGDDTADYTRSSESQLEEDKRDDDVLPGDLHGAGVHASGSTAYYISAGGTRAIVELLLPELESLAEEGAQQQLWELAGLYLENLQKELGNQQVKAIFPDAGAAALLQHTWSDATFGFGSLNDRRPVKDDDDVVVLVLPGHQMLGEVQKIASFLDDDNEWPVRPLIMWNPRLFSGDVGIGLNVRRIRDRFMSTFTVVYSMRPFPEGIIFRRYPGLWQVFVSDKARPGCHILAKEQPSRPVPDDLDLLLLKGPKENNEEPSPFVNAMAALASLARFMRLLAK